jgi:hypothetical protein
LLYTSSRTYVVGLAILCNTVPPVSSASVIASKKWHT